MFNVGGMQLLVVALVALIVLGPDKLPAFVRQAGQVMSELRRISGGFQADLRSALEEVEDHDTPSLNGQAAPGATEADAPATPASPAAASPDGSEPAADAVQAAAAAELEELLSDAGGSPAGADASGGPDPDDAAAEGPGEGPDPGSSTDAA